MLVALVVVHLIVFLDNQLIAVTLKVSHLCKLGNRTTSVLSSINTAILLLC